PRSDSGRLPTWYGSPFDAKNVRAFLTAGVPLCQVGNPERVVAGGSAGAFREEIPATGNH
ncbi:MAG: hypothetical protein MJD61_21575, partial [Proteobacteria bacterium]|nr:hypothetical protein [Pseudomonadota bacterium]